ncbi:MAG: alanine--glyoxylate aminotransferase family protein [Actinomycetota bacterium]|nr:alanine--glyoxylate aminotransferase family protein [Actinomycetota bacterium]
MSKLPVRLLCGPGPSDVAPSVLEVLSRPILGHLDPAFLALAEEVKTMLRTVFQTANETTFAVSGTGSAGMECALVNVIEPGDDVVVGVAGLFGLRLAEIARRCGGAVRTIEVEFGKPIPVERLIQALPAKVLAVVHAETSTGMRQSLEGLGDACRETGTLLVVDAVTSLGGIPLSVDEAGIDVCYSGTQKCLSVPPGLAPITFSDAALEGVRRRGTPVRSWYLDVGLLTQYWGEERTYHHTAPTGMIAALHEGLRLVLDEGLEARWQRHQTLGGELQIALAEMGFRFLAEAGHRLPQLSATFLPDKIGDERVKRRRLLDDFGIEVGAGFGPLSGKGWRIGLMGESCRPDKLARLVDGIRAVVS